MHVPTEAGAPEAGITGACRQATWVLVAGLQCSEEQPALTGRPSPPAPADEILVDQGRRDLRGL